MAFISIQTVGQTISNSLQTLRKADANALQTLSNSFQTLYKLLSNGLEIPLRCFQTLCKLLPNPFKNVSNFFQTLCKPFANASQMPFQGVWNAVWPKLQCAIRRVFLWKVTYTGARYTRVSTVLVVPIQQQNNGSDCRVFAAAFATSLVLGVLPHLVNFNVPKMRNHLCSFLKVWEMEMFPSQHVIKHLKVQHHWN